MDVYKDVGVCSLEKATSGCLPLPMLRSELGHGAKHWELYMDVYMDVGVMETATSEKLGHGAQTSTEAWAPGKPKPVYEGKPCSPRGRQARFASIRGACTIAAQSPVQAPAPVASIRVACTEHQHRAPSTSTVHRAPAPCSGTQQPMHGAASTAAAAHGHGPRVPTACARHTDVYSPCRTWICTCM